MCTGMAIKNNNLATCYVVTSFFLLFSVSVTNAQCFDTNFCFSAGEKVNYKVVYNWHFIWLNAGWVEFEVKESTFMKRDVYHLYSFGSTFKGYDLFFKVRDCFESYLDMKTLKPLWFKRNTYEGGYEVNNQYLYDHRNDMIFSFTENSYKPLLRDTLDMPFCTFDVLSLVYYSRNLDFSGLEVNDTIPVSTIIDNELFNLYIRYLGKETLETKDGHVYNCIKFSALLVEGTIFKGGEDLFVWITDDKNRIPVLIEAKILVGSVKALLSSTEGLRNKMTAKVR